MAAGDAGEAAQEGAQEGAQEAAQGAAQGAIVRLELEGLGQAIAGYDEILWKIRAGYFGILYGALTIFWGTGGLISTGRGEETLPNLISNKTFTFTASVLIVGVSLAAFFVDFAYLRKKLKVVVARDRLIEIAYDRRYAEDAEKVKGLLSIAGEASRDELPAECHEPYVRKRNWNLFWIHLPLYATAPAMAIVVFAVGSAL